MTNPAISLQLYAINDAYTADPEGTLARLATIGFTTVEAFNFVVRADELAEAFARHGLSAATGHAPLASDVINRPDGEVRQVPSHDDVFAAAKKLGITTVIDPYVEPARWQTREQITDTAQRLNAAAKVAATHGISVGYHNHGHELASVIDGQFALEILAEQLDPEVVLEVDLYWAAVGGADLPGLLERLGDRVIALHIKDGTLEPELTAAFPPGDQVPAGLGKVPLLECLAAAPSTQFAVIEFDHFGGDVLDAVEASYQFLATQGLS